MWMTGTAGTKEGNAAAALDIYSANSSTAIRESKCQKGRSRDQLEISKEGSKKQEAWSYITVMSGKDTLVVTKDSKNNNFIIHFMDSAQVNRTVDRGYITVNGKRIDLSEETKQSLKENDKQAQAKREFLHALYTAKQNAEAARQQGEVVEQAFEERAKMMEIARRIAKGGIVPPSDEQKLMQFSPEMYMMAKSLAAMAESKEKHDSLFKEEEEPAKETSENARLSETCEVQMSMSMEAEPQVMEISAATVSLN
ncbi:MAG: hypothetical protein HFI75_00320 [Lachnospiraceae bacterium]|nr:hypothetical protein [Lachnospiraceae bacterium]